MDYIYWDSNCFISYFSSQPERIQTIESMLEDIKNDGTKKIITSAIAKVEVAHVQMEQLNGILDTTIEAKIDEFWTDTDILTFVDVHQDIALTARQFLRNSIPEPPKLKPYDCIHLATAAWIKAKEFNTYDERLWKHSNRYGFPICPPHCNQLKLPGL